MLARSSVQLRNLILLLGSLLSLVPWVSPLAQADPLKIRISLTSAAASTKGKAAQKFKEILESSTKKDMLVEISNDGQLYQDREELDALALGAVEILIPSFIKFDTIGAKEFSLFTVPYLFRNFEDVHAVVDGPIGQRLSQRLEPRGMKILAFWDIGFTHFHSNRPVPTPDQIKGSKLKIYKNRVLEAIARSLKSTPITVNRTRALQAYKKKEVDTGSSPLSNFLADHLDDAQPYLTLTSHGFHGYAVTVSLKFWTALSAIQKNQILEAMKQTTEFERRLAVQEESQIIDQLKKSGKVQVHSPRTEELAQWRGTLVPVQTQFKREPEGNYIQAVQDLIGELK